MYLTAQRVISPSGETAINGFLYEHGTVAWSIPPEPVAGSIGDLVHAFIRVPQGGNKVLSFVDVVAPDATPFDRVLARLSTWMSAQAARHGVLPWTGVDDDMRFGLHMVSAFAKTWKLEVARLLMTCRMTLDREPSTPEEVQP